MLQSIAQELTQPKITPMGVLLASYENMKWCVANDPRYTALFESFVHHAQYEIFYGVFRAFTWRGPTEEEYNAGCRDMVAVPPDYDFLWSKYMEQWQHWAKNHFGKREYNKFFNESKTLGIKVTTNPAVDAANLKWRQLIKHRKEEEIKCMEWLEIERDKIRLARAQYQDACQRRDKYLEALDLQVKEARDAYRALKT